LAGPFYPKDIENSKWLKFYSNIFNYFEIEPSFYRIPNEFVVKKWYRGPQRTFDDLGWTYDWGKNNHAIKARDESVQLFQREPGRIV
jgi:Protein of unknown function DUF72